MALKNSCVVVGSGMGGLAIASLLARAGYGVTVLEAHASLIGGYAQTIGNDKYQFAAGPRYLWNFGPGEPGYRFLKKCNLLDKVEMVELDRRGFDRIYVDDCEPIVVPSGWDEYEAVLTQRFPAEARNVAQFFRLCRQTFDFFAFAEGQSITLDPWASILAKYACSGRLSVLSLPGFWRRSKWTLQQAFQHCGLSQKLQAVLYGHGMILALPKEDVSFYAYVAATLFYHRGSYYPKQGMSGFVEAMVDSITSYGGSVRVGQRVVSVESTAGRVSSVTTESGERLTADTFVCNTDPRQFLALFDIEQPAKRFPRYEHSLSLTSLYLGITDVDALKDHFGPWNIWYAAASQDHVYESDPGAEAQTLYLNSPTLVTKSVIDGGGRGGTVTGFVPSNYDTFAALRRSGAGYDRAVEQHKDMILRLIEKRFIPNLQDVLDYCAIRTPWDNAEAVLAPKGNVYGRRLTPKGALQRIPWKGVMANLYFVGSVVGFAGIASVIQNACTVYEHLSGDRVN